MSDHFKKLRSQLPYRYASLIAERTGDITVRQVRCVFKEEITDKDIVSRVVDAAIEIRKEYDFHSFRIETKIDSRKKFRKREAV